jgi:predicted transcriptional regulator
VLLPVRHSRTERSRRHRYKTMNEPLESKIKQLLMHNKSMTVEHLAEVFNAHSSEVHAALKRLAEQEHVRAGERDRRNSW